MGLVGTEVVIVKRAFEAELQPGKCSGSASKATSRAENLASSNRRARITIIAAVSELVCLITCPDNSARCPVARAGRCRAEPGNAERNRQADVNPW